MLQNLEAKISALSLKTLDEGKKEGFNALQLIDSLSHDLGLIQPPDFVGCAALLFSPSFPHNLLDFLNLVLKSKLSKDLVEERQRIHHLLAEFITTTGAGVVQDHLLRLRQCTEVWVVFENSSKTLISCQSPLQQALEDSQLDFTSSLLDIAKLARVLKDRYLYGKAAEGVSAGVKGNLLCTLGQLCKRCPSVFKELETPRESLCGSLRRLCLVCVEEQIKSNDVSLPLTSGALSGLRHALFSSAEEVEEREVVRIYQCLRFLMKIPADLKRFEVPAQALMLLSSHSNLFAKEVMQEPDVLFDEVRSLIHSKHEKIKKVAFPACLKVLYTIASCLGKVSSSFIVGGYGEEEEEEEEEDNQVQQSFPLPDLEPTTRRAFLNLFMKRFSEFIQQGLKGASTKEMRKDIDLAIHGYGLFAPAVVSLTDETRLSEVMFKLFELSDRLKDVVEEKEKEFTYSGSHKVASKLFQRVRFLSTYGRIVTHLSSSLLAQESVLDRFVKEITSLQQEFAQQDRVHLVRSPMSYNIAVEEVLQGLSTKGACFLQVVGRIVPPMLKFTFSSFSGGEEEFFFASLWKLLLVSRKKSQVLDSVLSFLLDYIPTLNLECATIAEEGEVEEEDNNRSSTSLLLISEGVAPRSLGDVKTFHHITLFLSTLQEAHLPLGFLPLFSRLAAEGIERNPLLSSWYRLMGLVFSNLEKYPEMDESTLICLDKFLETSCMRCNQYQDELLGASLMCVLKCPQGVLLETHLKNLTPCLVMALRVGLGHPPLAELALEELERWILAGVRNLVSIVYPHVLPELGSYLSLGRKELVESTLSHGEEEEIKALRRRWKVSQKKAKKKKLSIKEEKMPLELRVVRILGLVGGHNHLVIPKLETVLLQSQTWDPRKRLQVTLPWMGLDFHLFLDGLLPRVTWLATSSAHRQTKIAACEVLHSLILIMLGTSATEPTKSGEYFIHLFEHLFPSILRLAVDIDPVTRSLFYPMVEQLAKWFAREDNSAEASTLLDSVIEALGDSQNGALRNLAAKTLGVFVRWTFKTPTQVSAKRTRLSLNSSVLLRRIYALMRHPDPFKRLGSNLAFETFYRDFREESKLVDEHVLMFLESSLISLRLSHYDPPALGTGEAALQVVKRIQRVVLGKVKELQVESPNRLAFSSLSKLCVWLWELCSCRETALRTISQELFEKLNTQKSLALEVRVWPTAAVGGSEFFFDECSALVDVHWWVKRRNLPVKFKEDKVHVMISSVLESLLKQPPPPAALSSRVSTSLVQFLRLSVIWAMLCKHVPLTLWEGLVLALVNPKRLGMDLEDVMYKSSIPSSVQALVKHFGPQPIQTSPWFPSLIPNLSAESLLSGKSEMSSVLRAGVVLLKAGVKLPPQDVEALAQVVYRIPLGTSAQVLRDGAAVLRLCFELGWPMSSLVKVLLSSNPLNGGDQTEGFIFFQHFQQEVLSRLVQSPPTEWFDALMGALDLRLVSSSSPSSQSFQILSSLDPNSDVIKAFYPHLGKFGILGDQLSADLIPLLGQVFKYPMHNEEEAQVVLDCFQALISSRHLSLTKKLLLVEHCLSALLFSPRCTPRAISVFEKEVVGQHFPISATKLTPGSLETEVYLRILSVVFSVLVRTQSLPLLQVLCNRCFKEFDLPIHAVEIRTCLQQLALAIKFSKPDGYLPFCLETLRSLTKEASEALRRSKLVLFDSFLLPLVARFGEHEWEALLLSKFYQDKPVMVYLLFVIENTLELDVSKECCYKTLTHFFLYASLETVQKIQKLCFPSNQAGNEATKVVLKQAKKILTEACEKSLFGKSSNVLVKSSGAVVVEPASLEEFVLNPDARLWNAVYTCMSSIMVKTQNQAKFFDQLFFFYGSDIFHALVPIRKDASSEPKFVEKDIPLEENEEGVNLSALAGMLTEASTPEGLYRLCLLDSQTPTLSDCLNNLPAMNAMLCALDGMCAKRLIRFEEIEPLPPFVSTILSSLQDKRCSPSNGEVLRQTLNIRLFAAKVVVNRPHLFLKSSSFLTLPLMELLVDLESIYVGTELHRGFHSFLQDVVEVLILFSTFQPVMPTQPGLLPKFFVLLFLSAKTSFHVRLVNELMKNCRGFEMDFSPLLSGVRKLVAQKQDQDSQIRIALLLLKACGDSGFSFASIQHELFSLLFSILSSVKVSSSLVRLCTQVLSFVVEEDIPKVSQWLEKVLQSGMENEKCLNLLSSVLQSHPQVLSNSIFTSVLHLLNNLEGDFLHFGLDIVSVGTTRDKASEVYQTLLPLLSRGRLLSVENAHVPSISSTLGLITKLFDTDPGVKSKMSQDSWIHLVALLLFHHPASSVRLQCFDFLSRMESLRMKSCLLPALTDSNEGVQKGAFEYWEKSCPGASFDRFLFLMENMNPYGIHSGVNANLTLAVRKRVESYWVSHLSQLLLCSVRSSPGYEDKNLSLLFKEPLQASVNFEAMNLKLEEEVRSSQSLMLTPLFLSTQEDSYHNQAQSLMVRATQQEYVSFPASQSSSQQDVGVVRRSVSSNTEHPSQQKRLVVFRKYRQGELPDIQIGRRELFEPLIQLCGLDPSVGFLFLLAFVPVLVEAAHQAKKPIEALVGKVSLLLQSDPTETQFVTCLLEFVHILSSITPARVDPNLIGKQSLQCKSYATGIFVLESLILHTPQVVAKEGKKVKLDSYPVEHAWNQLYSLYSALNETDVLLGLSERSSSQFATATRLELGGSPSKAIEKYKEIIDQDVNLSLPCMEARGRCYRLLQNWNAGFSDLDGFLVSQEELFGDKKRLLPLYVGSGLKSGLDRNRVLEFLDKFSNSQSDVFEQTIPVEYILGELMRNPPDWGRALDRTNRAMKRFVNDFASQPVLATATKQVLIQPLPQFVTFMHFFHHRKALNASFFHQLETTLPLKTMDGPEVWESVYSQRLWMLSLVCKEGEGLEGMEHHLSHLLVLSFEQALESKQFDIAKMIVKEMKRLGDSEFSSSPTLDLTCALLTTDLVCADVQSRDYQTRLNSAYQKLSVKPNLELSSEKWRRMGKLAKQLGKAEEALEAFQKQCDLLPTSAEALYDLGCFAEEEHERFPQKESLVPLAITNLLRAFALGSSLASNAFPRVLKLAVWAPKLHATLFQTELDSVPTRYLLKWISQMLSYFDQSSVVDNPLHRLAQEFPQSLVYPFRVSKESLLQLDSTKPEVLSRLEVLHQKMNLPPVVGLFCSALEYLAPPELRMKELVRKLETLLTKAESNPSQRRKCVEFWEESIHGVLFSEHAGQAYVDYAKAYKTNFQAVQEDLSLSQVKQLLTELPDKPVKYISGKCDLSLFSSWLEEFASSQELQMPGSVDAWHGLPEEEGENPIASFDSQLLCLASMRVPKRLTIRGVHGSKDFLVKSGEDLRLDERIEQLFAFMNSLMAADQSCASSQLKIQTYRVIPVSLSCGLIEWVPNSKPLKSIIETQYFNPFVGKPIPTPFADLQNMPCEKAWLALSKKYSEPIQLYSAPDEVLQDEFAKITNTIPHDLLRRHFLGISSTPEAFLTLKKCFAQSLATLSISSWILGIGDRHLDNFLMNSLGQLVSIDFGQSFGIAVALLPIPETVPFRCSPQLSEFLAPLNTQGTLFHSARKTLNCLREGRVRLLQVMEVFINEPLMDWIAQVGKVKQSSVTPPSSSTTTSSSLSQTESWKLLSKSRVRVADLKMRGVKPSLVMSAELRERRLYKSSMTKNKQDLECVVEVVCRNAKRKGERVQKGVGTLMDGDEEPWIANTVSVSDQVEELLRMATNEAMLLRQYQGARQWI